VDGSARRFTHSSITRTKIEEESKQQEDYRRLYTEVSEAIEAYLSS